MCLRAQSWERETNQCNWTVRIAEKCLNVADKPSGTMPWCHHKEAGSEVTVISNMVKPRYYVFTLITKFLDYISPFDEGVVIVTVNVTTCIV